MLPIGISQFCAEESLLNLQLWEKQSEILEKFWRENLSLAVFALGRRSGKTLMASAVAIYAAIVLEPEYKKFLRANERFYIVSVATTLDQSKIAIQNIKDLVKNSPVLSQLIVRETADSLELSNGAVFKAMPASSRGSRGMPVALLIFDEIAHTIDSEAGNASGYSLYQALAPSVAQFGRLGKILLLSSPWVKSGIFWDLYQQSLSGEFSHMMCVNLPSWEVNPTLSRDFLEQEKRRDPQLFEVEYGAQFSGSISAFLDWENIDNCIIKTRGMLPPMPKFQGRYVLSLDPAKGGRDEYTACIAHYDGDRFVIDLLHKFEPSFSNGKKLQVDVSQVENWILDKHSEYGFLKVVLDQYNSLSTIQKLSGRVPIDELTWTMPNKMKAFGRLKELINAFNFETYSHDQAIRQLKGLTLKLGSNGNWSVSGGTGAAVDDFASAIAGAVLAIEPETNFSDNWLDGLVGDGDDDQWWVPAKPYRFGRN